MSQPNHNNFDQPQQPSYGLQRGQNEESSRSGAASRYPQQQNNQSSSRDDPLSQSESSRNMNAHSSPAQNDGYRMEGGYPIDPALDIQMADNANPEHYFNASPYASALQRPIGRNDGDLMQQSQHLGFASSPGGYIGQPGSSSQGINHSRQPIAPPQFEGIQYQQERDILAYYQPATIQPQNLRNGAPLPLRVANPVYFQAPANVNNQFENPPADLSPFPNFCPPMGDYQQINQNQMQNAGVLRAMGGNHGPYGNFPQFPPRMGAVRGQGSDASSAASNLGPMFSGNNVQQLASNPQIRGPPAPIQDNRVPQQEENAYFPMSPLFNNLPRRRPLIANSPPPQQNMLNDLGLPGWESGFGSRSPRTVRPADLQLNNQPFQHGNQMPMPLDQFDPSPFNPYPLQQRNEGNPYGHHMADPIMGGMNNQGNDFNNNNLDPYIHNNQGLDDELYDIPSDEEQQHDANENDMENPADHLEQEEVDSPVSAAKNRSKAGKGDAAKKPAGRGKGRPPGATASGPSGVAKSDRKKRTKVKLSDFHKHFENILEQNPNANHNDLHANGPPPPLPAIIPPHHDKFETLPNLGELPYPLMRTVPAHRINGFQQRQIYSFPLPHPPYYGNFAPTPVKKEAFLDPKTANYFPSVKGQPPKFLDGTSIPAEEWNSMYNAANTQIDKHYRFKQHCAPHETAILRAADRRNGLVRWLSIRLLMRKNRIPEDHIDRPQDH